MYLVYGLGWRFEGVVDDGGEGLQWSNAAFSIYVSLSYLMYISTQISSPKLYLISLVDSHGTPRLEKQWYVKSNKRRNDLINT